MGVPRFLIGSLAGALAAPIVLLAACGGDDASIADPPVSPRPTSSSPTGTPPHESPEAFIRRFAKVEQNMENTGETGAYADMTRRCKECRDLADQVQGFYLAGGYVHWAGWTIRSIRPYFSAKRPHSYAVSVISAPTNYRESAGGPTKHLDGGPATEIISIKKAGGSWLITARAKLAT